MGRISDNYSYEPLNAEELLSKSLYEIPAYQRGYAWNADSQVRVLLDDLRKAFEEDQNNLYFLGEVTVVRSPKDISDETPIYEVIDGQQRLTTLQLLVMGLKYKIDQVPPAELNQVLEDTDTRREFLMSPECYEHGRQKDGKNFRVKPNPESLVILEKIKDLLTSQNTQDGNKFHSEPTNESQAKIIDAWEIIIDYIDKNFHTPASKLKYLAFVLKNSVIVRLSVSKAEQALDIFWKANGRGLPLTDADLLKNMLFMNVKNEDFRTIEKLWNSSSTLLFSGKRGKKDSMLPFLKAWAQIIHGKNVGQSEIFSRWTELLDKGSGAISNFDPSNNPEQPLLENKLDINQRTLVFAQLLHQKAQNSLNISKGKHPQTGKDFSTNSFGTKFLNLQQQSQVLLAGSHLSESSYQLLLDIVETRSLVYQFSTERVQDFERIIHPWSRNIACLPKTATRQELIAASLPALSNLDEILNTLEPKLLTLNYGVNSHRKIIRYALGRATSFAEKNFHDKHTNVFVLTKELVTPTKLENLERGQLKLQLDHIFPKANSRRQEFDSRLVTWIGKIQEENTAPERVEYWRKYDFVNCIGNLSLLKSDENLDQLDVLPGDEKKIAHYCGNSQTYVLNAAIDTRGEVVLASDAWKLGVRELRSLAPTSLEAWGPADILMRAKLYATLLERDFRNRLS